MRAPVRLHWFAVALAGSLAGLGLTPASAQSASAQPAISVTGEASISATPDLATVDGGVTSDGKTAREAADTNNKTMGTVLLALKGLGIPDKDIRTNRLSLFPQSSPLHGQNGPMQITGYRATNTVTVTLHDVSGVASTIDALVGAGANDIGGVSFSVADASKLLDDARAGAIADAQRKAEIYARAAGVTLGSPLSIVETGAPEPRTVFARNAAFAPGAAPLAPTPVAPGETTLRISVHVSYAIHQ